MTCRNCHTCQHLIILLAGYWCRRYRRYEGQPEREMPCEAWRERVDEVVRRGGPITKHN